MSLRIYMDVNVPGAITLELRRLGVDVLTAQEDGRHEWSDPDLLNRAGELDRVLFTRDDDFLREGTFRQRERYAFSGIIYAHQIRVTVGQCVRDIALLADLLEGEEFKGNIQHLPLR